MDFLQEIGVHVKVEIPADYQFTMPENFEQTFETINENFYYHQSAEIKENHIFVKYEFFLGELLVEPANYKELKQFFNQVNLITQEEILIKKSN